MAIDTSGLPYAKPEPRKRTKRRRDRVESVVKSDVRAECVERDNYCRFSEHPALGECDGPSEWAHLEERMRSRTRGMQPTERHTRLWSIMLCRRHHNEFDGRARPRVEIESMSIDGADGALLASRNGVVVAC